MLRNKSLEKIICAPFKFVMEHGISGTLSFIMSSGFLSAIGVFAVVWLFIFVITLAQYDTYVSNAHKNNENMYFERWMSCAKCTLEPSNVATLIISNEKFENSVHIPLEEWGNRAKLFDQTATSKFVYNDVPEEFSGAYVHLKIDDSKMKSFTKFAYAQPNFDDYLQELILDYTSYTRSVEMNVALSLSTIIRNENSIRMVMCIEGDDTKRCSLFPINPVNGGIPFYDILTDDNYNFGTVEPRKTTVWLIDMIVF